MITTSVLPGRVRFEIPTIKGQLNSCTYLQDKLMNTQGVFHVSTNHRTGRLLIKFDEKVLSPHILKTHINAIFKSHSSHVEDEAQQINSPISHGNYGDSIVSTLLNVAVHALLPKPLDVLFPIAMRFVKSADS